MLWWLYSEMFGIVVLFMGVFVKTCGGKKLKSIIDILYNAVVEILVLRISYSVTYNLQLCHVWLSHPLPHPPHDSPCVQRHCDHCFIAGCVDWIPFCSHPFLQLWLWGLQRDSGLAVGTGSSPPPGGHRMWLRPRRPRWHAEGSEGF